METLELLLFFSSSWNKSHVAIQLQLQLLFLPQKPQAPQDQSIMDADLYMSSGQHLGPYWDAHPSPPRPCLT